MNLAHQVIDHAIGENPMVTDPSVFTTFVIVVVSVLAVGGLIILTAVHCFHKPCSGIVKTYRAWLMMAPLPFMAILLGRSATILTIALLSVLTFCEYSRATGLDRARMMKWLVVAGIVIQTGATIATDPMLGTAGWYGMLMVMPVFTISAIAMVPIWRNQPQGQVQFVCLAVFGYLYFGWMFGQLAFLANTNHAAGYLLYLVFAVSITDVAAFTCGNLFGRRQLRSEISPDKTVGGAIGGLGVALWLPWLFGFALPDCTVLQKVLTGLIVGIGGQMGDLTISYFKRDLGIKDMGTLIPGHGGLLDRLDSLIFTAPLFFHLIRWVHGS